MAEFVEHISCESCGSKDNLAVYSDGGMWCFGCSKYCPPTLGNRIKQKQNQLTKPEEVNKVVSLPEDYDPFYFPLEALQWVAQYELTQQDLKRNRVGWSESQHRLIFPFIVDGHLAAYQGRYFKGEVGEFGERSEQRKPPKWLSRGKIHEFLYILKSHSKELIIVEDPLSAIKLQKYGYSSCPLFGSQVTPTQKKCLLFSGYQDLTFWLDRDKLSTAYKYSKELNDLGFNCRVVSTDNDPKEVPHEQFESVLK